MSSRKQNHRRSIRLPGYDYASQGVYYLTICSFRKWQVFGRIVENEIRLNAWGTIVRDEWLKTGALRSYITLDEFVVMPNHCHGILIINERGGTQNENGGIQIPCRGTARCAPTDDKPTDNTPAVDISAIDTPINHVPAEYLPTPRQFGSMIAGSIPAIVRAFKSAVTQRINRLRQTPSMPVWQRNYYERIIRNEAELNRIRRYIRDNPGNWAYDELNSGGQPKNFLR